ncbi:MAG: MotA/TolQ/ExbB proton channel family protein [Pseudomonadota bacterium]
MKFTRTISAALALGIAAFSAQAQEASNLRDLLQLVEEGRTSEAQESRDRESRFRSARSEQQNLLAQARAEKAAEERRSQELEDTFEVNELAIVEAQEQLNNRLGSLKELFGVLQQVAGDTRGLLDASITSAQYPGRGDFLTELAQKMGNSSKLATIEEIERLWFEIQREMTASGEVARFTTEVVGVNGERTSRDVVRVGVFNLVGDGAYLQYVPETGNVSELPSQPQGRFVSTTSDLVNAASGPVLFGMDPTRGSLLGLLIQAPTVQDRIEQGGLVGNVIIGLGIFGVLLALWRLAVLMIVSGKVSSQLKSSEISSKNPLGRVMMAYEENKAIEPDALEVKMGEAIMKEMPSLNMGITLLKVISVVAPLLGLLGTVTGMIKTFQAITLFGTGDPKLMAGGISQALMTTVLGLVVAIPTVLLHTIVAGRAKKITHVLQERSAGLIAKRMENG